MIKLKAVEVLVKLIKGAKIKSIQASTTPDPGYQWKSDKLTVIHHKREPRGQSFQAGDHKAHINRRTQRYNKHTTEKYIKDPQKSTALERSVKYFTGGLEPVARCQPHP